MTAEGVGVGVSDDADDATVVVSRLVPGTVTGANTVEVSAVADLIDDATVVVERTHGAAVSAADEAEEFADVGDETIVVARPGTVGSGGGVDCDGADDATVLVPRTGASAGFAGVGGAELDDATVVVVPGAGVGGAGADDVTVVPARSRREVRGRRAERTRIVLPEGQTPSMRGVDPVEGVEREVYRPRPVPEPPAELPVVLGGPEASRAVAPRMPSVRRATVRLSVVAVAVTVVACAVSVVGLVWLVRFVFGG